MTNAAFMKHISEGKWSSIYTLVASEPILLNEAISALKEKVLTTAPDFNSDDFLSEQNSPQECLDAAQTLPMMAPVRWVSYRNLHKLKSADVKPLLEYLKDPSPTTVLCLTADKLDGRTKLAQQLKKVTQLYEFTLPRQNELPMWIQGRAQHLGYQLDREAAFLLGDLIGPNIGELDRSLEKLWNYRGGEGEIDFRDVESVVAPTRMHSIFELTDALGSRDLPKATLLLRNAMEGGEAALKILAMITRQLRILLKMRDNLSRSPNEIAKSVGVPPFLIKPLLKQANRYTNDELLSSLRAAKAADFRLKSTKIAPHIVMDRLLIEITELGNSKC